MLDEIKNSSDVDLPLLAFCADFLAVLVLREDDARRS